MFDDVIETARAGPSAACQKGARSPLSGPTSSRPSPVSTAIAPDGRIDHRENHRVMPDVRKRVGQDERACPDIKRGNAMGEIDNGAPGRDSADNRVADTDPLVPITEIGQEDDRARQRFRGHRSKAFAPRGRRCKRLNE